MGFLITATLLYTPFGAYSPRCPPLSPLPPPFGPPCRYLLFLSPFPLPPSFLLPHPPPPSLSLIPSPLLPPPLKRICSPPPSCLSDPPGHLTEVLQINYVYILCLLCGMVIFMIPLIAFPRAVSHHPILSSISPPFHSALLSLFHSHHYPALLFHSDVYFLQLNIWCSSLVGSYTVIFGKFSQCM